MGKDKYPEDKYDDKEEGLIDVNIFDVCEENNGQGGGADFSDFPNDGENDELAGDGGEQQRYEMRPLLISAVENDKPQEDASVASSLAARLQSGSDSLPVAAHVRSRRTKLGGALGGWCGYDEDGQSNPNGQAAGCRSCIRRKDVNVNDGSDDHLKAGNVRGDEFLAMDGPTASSPDGLAVESAPIAFTCGRVRKFCRNSSKHLVRTTVSVMNLLARILLWGSFFAMTIGVVWYSRELKMNGTDPHLIAWFSAGAFVLLGFPISMCGIFMHLTNYYQPNVQCYVVRILWMVPIYSIESWLCLRFHTLAIYIETLRDCYESYVLYSFLQFLIEVLGGEEALVMMLKDKSPTRGVHMSPLNWCVKPWLMGQPVSRRVSYSPEKNCSPPNTDNTSASMSISPAILARPVKRIRWTSPFFVKCKFGVLQYVLLKFVSAIFVMLLEIHGLYKEGDFTPRGGYLYICLLTNISQCWALYCLVFFYYATKNELGPIRPVGKFLSVKAVVFFTWWQSLGISILFQMGMIPHYAAVDDGREWTSEAVAKGLQDYLICIEMFVAAIVHTFVFPHTDYLEPLGGMNHWNSSGNRRGRDHHMASGARRLGRKGRFWDAALAHQYHRRGDDRSECSKSSGGPDPCGSTELDVDLGACSSIADSEGNYVTVTMNNLDAKATIDEGFELRSTNSNETRSQNLEAHEFDRENVGSVATLQAELPRHQRQGFVRALLDSTVPRDVFDETVGIVKGEFHIERKTLLHHAATSDEYDLFSKSSKRRRAATRQVTQATRNLNPQQPAICGKNREHDAQLPVP